MYVILDSFRKYAFTVQYQQTREGRTLSGARSLLCVPLVTYTGPEGMLISKCLPCKFLSFVVQIFSCTSSIYLIRGC